MGAYFSILFFCKRIKLYLMMLKIYTKTVFRERFGKLLKGLKILRAEINNIPVSIPVLMKHYKIDAKQLKVEFISYRFDYALIY